MPSFLPTDLPDFPAGANGNGDWRPYKTPCRVATTANQTGTFSATGGTTGTGSITATPKTIDGVVVAVGDRILLKNQTTETQNGIYVVTAVTTTANIERASDSGTSGDFLPLRYVRIAEGTVAAGKYFKSDQVNGFVLNTDDIDWTEVTPPRKPYVGAY